MPPPVFDLARFQKIINIQYSHQAADSLGNPFGPVAGWALNPSENQSWKIRPIPGSDTFTIQNQATGTYASVCKEIDGGAVVGSGEAFPWALVPVEPDVYQIVSTQQGYIWFLNSSDNNYPILLQDPINSGKNALWKVIYAA